MNIGVVMYQTSFSKGQELVAQRMVQEFVRQGHRAFLIAGPYHDNKPISNYEDLEHSVDGYLYYKDSEFRVPLIRVGGYTSGWPPRRIMFRDFLNTLRHITDRFGLNTLISHSTLWNGPEWIAKFVTWKRMMKSQGLNEGEVVSCHMSHYQPPDPMRYDVMERTYRTTWNSMVLPNIFSTASLILCTTPIEEEKMVDLGCPKEKCHLYLSGVDEESFRNSRFEGEGVRSKYSIPEGVRLVTYLGTIEERKNPLAVVRVAKQLSGLRDVHFVVAGFPSNQHQQVMKEARGLTNLTYIGEINDAEKIELIRESYLNILLSHMEALGLTQIEFMYCGVPVVTSAVGGQAWLIRDGVDGIHVDGPKDIIGAAKAVRILVENPETRDELGQNARKRAENFTLAKMTSSLSRRLSVLKNSN